MGQLLCSIVKRQFCITKTFEIPPVDATPHWTLLFHRQRLLNRGGLIKTFLLRCYFFLAVKPLHREKLNATVHKAFARIYIRIILYYVLMPLQDRSCD